MLQGLGGLRAEPTQRCLARAMQSDFSIKMTRTDAEIREAVLLELEWDTRVEDGGIDVEVIHGVVALTGRVGSWASRVLAQEAAQRVAGVLDVANDVDVVLSPSAIRSDVDLLRAVRSSLDWDVFIPKTRIHTSVVDGLLTLEGEVDHFSQRDDAEKAVRNIQGIRRLFNKIRVKPAAAAPHEVQKSIEAALERRAAREARRINLDVHEGKVILSGAVHSWAERQSVVGAAKGTPGVRIVDDRLHIEP